MAQDEEKKTEGEAPPPETILETEKQRDPDEAVFAEQAIHAYANQALDQFRESVQNALDGFAAWLESNEDPKVFDNPGFNAQIGSTFLQEMVQACGGKDTPIGAKLFGELDGLVDMAARQEHEASFFVNELSRAARDFTWYLRDNLAAILSNQWDQLRDLAYQGSTDFIPALHAFGLPRMDWSGAGMKSTLTALADKIKEGTPKTQEEAVEKNPEEEQHEKEQLVVEEEQKNQQAV